MTNLMFFIGGLIVGAGMMYWWSSSAKSYGRMKGAKDKQVGLIEKQAEEKKRNMEAMMGMFGNGDERLTNNQVVQKLGLPESTVTRYFDELQSTGHLRQVGLTGQDVFYEKV